MCARVGCAQAGSLLDGPARSAALEERQVAKVFTRRREDVDHDRTLRAGDRLVGRARRDAPRPAGAELATLVADAEVDCAAEDDPELLVVVAVLGDDRARFELYDAQGDSLAVNRACRDALPDLLGSEGGEIGERAQRRLPRRKT